jgi:hypothetical protein
VVVIPCAIRPGDQDLAAGGQTHTPGLTAAHAAAMTAGDGGSLPLQSAFNDPRFSDVVLHI